jgi:hypothetical protein
MQPKGASQFFQAFADPIIDHAAVSAACRSAVRDIVASKPGVTQKPRTTIAPNRTIRINARAI